MEVVAVGVMVVDMEEMVVVMEVVIISLEVMAVVMSTKVLELIYCLSRQTICMFIVDLLCMFCSNHSNN